MSTSNSASVVLVHGSSASSKLGRITKAGDRLGQIGRATQNTLDALEQGPWGQKFPTVAAAWRNRATPVRSGLADVAVTVTVLPVPPTTRIEQALADGLLDSPARIDVAQPSVIGIDA